MLEQKSKYLNSIRVFPFFISFFRWNEKNKKSSIKEDSRKMENRKADNIPEKRFLQKLLEIKDRVAKFILGGLKFQSSVVTIVGVKKSLQ